MHAHEQVLRTYVARMADSLPIDAHLSCLDTVADGTGHGEGGGAGRCVCLGPAGLTLDVGSWHEPLLAL